MKKITLLLSFIVCVVFAQAQLLTTEDFNFTPATDLLGQGSWILTGAAATPTLQVTASSITYSGYPGSGIGNEVTLTNGQDLNKKFAPQTTSNVYASFIVNVSAISTSGDYFLNLGAETIGSAFVGRVFVKKESETGTKIAFGVMMTSGGTPSPTPTYSGFDYDLGTTYLIVLKHNNTGKVSSIIVNPSISSTEPTTGWIDNNQGTNAVPANIGAIGLRQPSASAALTAKLDGIRVATSWAALFSTTGTSNPSSSNELSAFVSGKNLMIQNAVEGSKVEIYSALGSKVQTSTLEDGKVSLDNLSKGLYVVRIGKKAQKFML